MKIGIISINMYSKGLNFACPLHTYAFQQFLLSNGIPCTVLNYKPVYFDNFNLKYPYDYYKERYDRCLAADPQSEEARMANEKKKNYFKEKMDSWEPLRRERAERYEKFHSFIEKNYIKTEKCYDSDLLETEDPGFDCYICATDVIWKNQPDFGFDRGFFLGSSCMEQKWKISYAASQGEYTADTPEEAALFYHYLEDFDALSVREEKLKDTLEKHFDRKVSHVLDPVLLHTADFYDKILIRPQEQRYVLLYYVMGNSEDTVRQAAAYARKHKLKIIEITDHPQKGGKLARYRGIDSSYRFDTGIEEWLGYLRYADCIFTNSFHACCFSILFEKNFYVGYRKGDKIPNLLRMFRLTDRIFARDPAIEKQCLATRIGNRLEAYMQRYLSVRTLSEDPVDYTDVRLILEQKRTKSADFILSAIHAFEHGKRHYHDYGQYKRALRYRIYYNSGLKNKPFSWNYSKTSGSVALLASGSVEYRPSGPLLTNDGSNRFLKNGYSLDHYKFKGWNVRLRIDNRWFWYLNDGTLTPKDTYQSARHCALYLFADEDVIPYFPVNRIAACVADAVWSPVP